MKTTLLVIAGVLLLLGIAMILRKERPKSTSSSAYPALQEPTVPRWLVGAGLITIAIAIAGGSALVP